MQWIIGKAIGDKPFAHFLDHIHLVGPAGNDQVGDLQPYSFFLQYFQGSEDRFEAAAV